MSPYSTTSCHTLPILSGLRYFDSYFHRADDYRCHTTQDKKKTLPQGTKASIWHIHRFGGNTGALMVKLPAFCPAFGNRLAGYLIAKVVFKISSSSVMRTLPTTAP